jgi:hypothetical protein
VDQVRRDYRDGRDDRLERNVERRALVAEIDEREPADQQGRRAGQRPYDDGEVDRPQLKNLPYTFITRDFAVFRPLLEKVSVRQARTP